MSGRHVAPRNFDCRSYDILLLRRGNRGLEDKTPGHWQAARRFGRCVYFLSEANVSANCS